MLRGRPARYYRSVSQFYHPNFIAIALFIRGAFIVVHADKYEIKEYLLESCPMAFFCHSD
ncbi:hypothetical protein ACTXT7_008732 [Hymenolepis weldensis]